MTVTVVVMTYLQPYALRLTRQIEAQADGQVRLVALVDARSAGSAAAPEREVLGELLLRWEVVLHDPADDWAAHRNAVLPYVEDESWVVMLDDDELVHEAFLADLDSATGWAPSCVEAFYLPRLNTFGDLAELPEVDWVRPTGFRYPDLQGRLFRRRGSIRYQSPVHESLVGYRGIFPLMQPSLTIRHHKTPSMQDASNDRWSALEGASSPVDGLAGPSLDIDGLKSAERQEVESIEELTAIARVLIGAPRAVQVRMAVGGGERIETVNTPPVDFGTWRQEPPVHLINLEVLDLGDGAPPLAYGHLDHPYEAQTPIQQIFDFFADLNHWRHHIVPGSLAIDVGAHSGDTTIVMAALVGVTGAVVAFDPNPNVFPTLEANARLNPQYKILCEMAAVADQRGVATFSDHNNLMCNGGLLTGLASVGEAVLDRVQALAPSTFEVETVRLDEVLLEKYPSLLELGLSFIKTDCEGFDAVIVQTLGGLVDKYRPVLFVEWFEWFNHEESRVLFEAIADIGYTPFDPQSGLPAVVDMKVADLICLPSGDAPGWADDVRLAARASEKPA